MISPSTLFTRLPEQATKRHFSAEDKIRINEDPPHQGPKESLEPGKKRLPGKPADEAPFDGAKTLRAEARQLKNCDTKGRGSANTPCPLALRVSGEIVSG